MYQRRMRPRLANLLAAAGRFPEAEADYRSALRLDPDHALAPANHAELVARPRPAAPMERP